MGVILVGRPWHETSGSLGLSFDLNQSLTFPGLSQLDGACSLIDYPHSDMLPPPPPPPPTLFLDFIGKRRQNKLFSWLKKASLELIRRLLEITEAECNHEFLLSVKNLRELGATPFIT